MNRKPLFGLRAEVLWHPDSPGMTVIAVRGFWGRLFKPYPFATLKEAIIYSEFSNEIAQRLDSGGIRVDRMPRWAFPYRPR